jgi:hypothetical protein
MERISNSEKKIFEQEKTKMATNKYAIPVVFFVEVEYDELPKNPLIEQQNIQKSFVEQLGYVVGDFDFIYDSISERISGVVNSIQVQKQ